MLNGMLPTPTVAVDFSQDTWWITGIKALFVVVFLILSVIMVLWVERRGLGRIQTRPGPNVHGPLGLFQALADAVKLLTKEDIWKSGADRLLYFLGPLIAAGTAFMVFAVIPFGPEITIGSYTTPMQLTDTSVAVLFILGVASLGIYGIILGGWSANSVLPLLGATRSAAQVISYELAMGMSLVSVFIMAGSMSTSDIVASQSPIWWAVSLFPAFVIYLISMVGEVNRLPFDLPECEGEIVAGHMTEYSSMKFAWYFLAEYINMFNVSAVATTLFLGGWRFPYGDVLFGGVLHQYGLPLLWFTIKLWIVVWCIIWVRGTLLRVRYDQLMSLGWKVLLPFSLAWLVIVGIMRVITFYNIGSNTQRMISVAVIFGSLIIAVWVIGVVSDRKQARLEAAKQAQREAPFDAFAGGYPVPPLPGQVLPPSPRMLARMACQSEAETTAGGLEEADDVKVATLTQERGDSE